MNGVKELMHLKHSIIIAIVIIILVSCSDNQNKLINGVQLPDISLANPQGDSISISSFRGKIVLVDFWASWCKPCRKANPKIVAIYDKYKDKEFNNAEGFEIVSISFDADKNKWLAAIKKDGLIWPNHISDLKAWKSEAVQVFQVPAIPASYLIDQNGIIIGKDLYYRDLDKILTKRLGKP